MERFKLDELVKWKQKKNKKPLIIRGARQVGKTWLAPLIIRGFLFFFCFHLTSSSNLNRSIKHLLD